MRTFLKFLISISIGLSLLGAFLPEIPAWLALSWGGIQKLYLWQLVTYIFIEAPPLSFGFVIQLAFNMYILWTFAPSLIDRLHPIPFLFLYFGSAILGGLAALPFSSAGLAGSTNAVYAALVSWMMLNQGARILLFFTVPFQAHWLICFLLALSLFLSLSSGLWAASAALAASIVYSYFFTLLLCRTPGPFTMLRPLERKLLALFEKKPSANSRRSKIYDIKTKEPILNDDQFMDAMLEQISRHGEGSLSAADKKRMQEISKRKQ